MRNKIYCIILILLSPFVRTEALTGIDSLKISIFGSSVAKGQGAEQFKGYADQYGQELKERYNERLSPNAFYISNISIGGNKTTDLLARYRDVVADSALFVIIGLSMGNEGIHESEDKQSVFNQFRDNMLTLIERLRSDGKVPVVVNNYTRGDYDDTDYAYIKKMNMLIHTWDVPSVNSLGAIDDGSGHWAQGFIDDLWHPNTAGHQEFMYAMVPSLFDALLMEKPLPQRDVSASLKLSETERIVLNAEGRIHPFTICLRVKTAGPALLLTFDSAEDESVASVRVNEDGNIVYRTPAADVLATTDSPMGDGDWHDVAVTYYYARNYTALYVDGEEVGGVQGNFTPGGTFTIGGDAFSLAEISFWRAGMNQDEMRAHNQGDMLKSSLEIYSPLRFDSDGNIVNLAQSANTLKFEKISN